MLSQGDLTSRSSSTETNRFQNENHQNFELEDSILSENEGITHNDVVTDFYTSSNNPHSNFISQSSTQIPTINISSNSLNKSSNGTLIHSPINPFQQQLSQQLSESSKSFNSQNSFNSSHSTISSNSNIKTFNNPPNTDIHPQNSHLDYFPRYLRIHPSHIAVARQLAQLTHTPLLPSSQIPVLIPMYDPSKPTLKYLLAEKIDPFNVSTMNHQSNNGVFTKYIVEKENPESSSDPMFDEVKEVSLESLRNSNFFIFGIHFPPYAFSLGMTFFILEVVALLIYTIIELVDFYSVGRIFQLIFVNIITILVDLVGILGLWRRNLSLLTISFGFHVSLLCLELLQIESFWHLMYILFKLFLIIFLWSTRESLIASWFTTSTLA